MKRTLLFAIAFFTLAFPDGVAGMPSVRTPSEVAVPWRGLTPANVIVSNTPPPDWESRRNESMELLCTKWNDRFAEGDGSAKRYSDEDTTDVAIAHMEARGIGWCATLKGAWTTWFNPDGLPLSNEEFVNRWLEQLNQIGLVGTDMSGAASAINGIIDNVDAAILAVGGVLNLLPPAVASLVAPVAALQVVLAATSTSKTCDTSHDYDLGLVGLVRIAYLYGPQGKNLLTPAAYNNLLDLLLTQRGGVAQWRDHPQLCGVTLPIPETENHIWMTESSRFLTNQLLRLRANPAKDPAIDVALGLQDWVNETNGMRERILDMLADVLASDFHEYNARPYARLTAKALEDLYDFTYPEDTEFKKAVQIVLDFISAKFAASSLQSRRSVPFRRLIDEENSTALFGSDDPPPADGSDKNDEETPRFLQLAGALDALNNERRGAISERNADTISFTGSSTYRVPNLIYRLITENGTSTGASYFDRYHHQGYGPYQQVYELYVGRPLYLLSAGGVFSPGWDPTSALDSVPVLSDVLSVTKWHDLVQLLSEKDQASAVWTTLMPTLFKVDRKGLIRIEGSANRETRNNTCVYPPGFACGLNPVLPVQNQLPVPLPVPPNPPEPNQLPAVPAGCVQAGEGNWQFVNLATTEFGCWQNFDLYVAFWSSPCHDDACVADAGGNTPSYGFFDVFDGPSQGISFAQFWHTILANNEGRSYSYRGDSGENVYTDYYGRNIAFDPGAPIGTWGILNDNQRDMTAWRPAQGDIVRNLYPASPQGQWRPSCVEVDDPVLQRRRVLDLSIHDQPAWCEFDIKPSNMCGCDHQRCPPNENIPCP